MFMAFCHNRVRNEEMVPFSCKHDNDCVNKDYTVPSLIHYLYKWSHASILLIFFRIDDHSLVINRRLLVFIFFCSDF